MGRFDEARSHLDHALELSPFDATMASWLIYSATGHHNKLGLSVQAVELDADYVWAGVNWPKLVP